MRPPLVVPEVRVARAAGDDERVVADRQPGPLAVRQAVDHHLAPREVEPRHLAQHHARVPLPPEQGAQRRRDLGRRERAGRDLVHERLEQREVLPVDERHVDRRAAQAADGLHPAEPAADDDDPVGGLAVHAATASSTCCLGLLDGDEVALADQHEQAAEAAKATIASMSVHHLRSARAGLPMSMLCISSVSFRSSPRTKAAAPL